MEFSNEISSVHYKGLYGTGKVSLGISARNEGVELSKEAKRGLNVAGLRDAIARNRSTKA